jgi:hypothetical protein
MWDMLERTNTFTPWIDSCSAWYDFVLCSKLLDLC